MPLNGRHEAAAKEKKHNWKTVQRDLVEDVLQIDRPFFPLGFVEHVGQHHHREEHEEGHAEDVDLVHEDDQEGVSDAPEHEH